MPALHLKPWTEQRMVFESEGGGRSARVSAGSHISDLVSLQKTILLCHKCAPKFSSAKNGYVTNKNIPFACARCDGCKENGMDRRVFIHHSNMPR